MEQKTPRKLLDQVSDAIRTKHYSYRTEQTYKDWIRRYILFHNKRHPKDMGTPEIQAFLTQLAAQRLVLATEAVTARLPCPKPNPLARGAHPETA